MSRIVPQYNVRIDTPLIGGIPGTRRTDVLSYNPDNHAEPDSANTTQTFWANEQTHPDSQP